LANSKGSFSDGGAALTLENAILVMDIMILKVSVLLNTPPTVPAASAQDRLFERSLSRDKLHFVHKSDTGPRFDPLSREKNVPTSSGNGKGSARCVRRSASSASRLSEAAFPPFQLVLLLLCNVHSRLLLGVLCTISPEKMDMLNLTAVEG
jgi:hypothetical protein